MSSNWLLIFLIGMTRNASHPSRVLVHFKQKCWLGHQNIKKKKLPTWKQGMELTRCLIFVWDEDLLHIFISLNFNFTSIEWEQECPSWIF